MPIIFVAGCIVAGGFGLYAYYDHVRISRKQ